MKYIVMDVTEGGIFTNEFDNLDDAIKAAGIEWNRLSYYDKRKRQEFYVLESIDSDYSDGYPVYVIKSLKQWWEENLV